MIQHGSTTNRSMPDSLTNQSWSIGSIPSWADWWRGRWKRFWSLPKRERQLWTGGVQLGMGKVCFRVTIRLVTLKMDKLQPVLSPTKYYRSHYSMQRLGTREDSQVSHDFPALEHGTVCVTMVLPGAMQMFQVDATFPICATALTNQQERKGRKEEENGISS